MKTIGQVLKGARLEKRVTFEKLEFETKIKKNFIEAIEEEDWDKLPSYSVVLGFVRNLAETLGISVEFALALLRRDYPPKKVKVSPSPDIENKVVWSPRLTFFLGIGVFLVVILGYLGFQYSRFVSPPDLEVDRPKEEETLLSKSIVVSGRTDTDANVTVNNQPVIVDQEGNFETTVEVTENTDKLVIKAVSRSGKETTVERKIKLDL